MAFDSYGSGKSESKGESQVDWDALNKYVVETAQLENRETLVGYVAVIADLGTQEQPDAEVSFTGSSDDEAEAIAANPNTYFKDGIDQTSKKKVRLKCWPQKPIQCVAVAVDFPDIIIDKGTFFGESNPLPLRLWLGGQFYTQDSGMIIGRPTPLKINKSTGSWSFDKKHLFHKMAVAAKLITPDGVFLPQDIDKLLGAAFQFEAQVFFKESKGKQYFTEYVKFVSGLGRGQSQPELLTTPYLIQFNQPNDKEALSQLRNHVINTMKRAENWEGSLISKQLEEAKPAKKEEVEQDEVQQEEVTKPKARAARKVAEPVEDDTDPDFPF